MKVVRRFSFSAPALLGLLLTACGGSVEPSILDQASTPAMGSPARGAAQICSARPREIAQGLDSCAVARDSMTIEVTGIAWIDPALAWKEGGRARLEVQYRNASDTDAVEYPGLVVASSDPRAQTDSEAHGDPIVHPDLYALSPCMVYDSRDHGFTLLSAVPSGTKLTFSMSVAVADGNGISSCGGTLPVAVASFVAP